nr:hypothetical protein [uncultured Gellertiella sp.]
MAAPRDFPRDNKVCAMLFGTSLFASVLKRIEDEEPPPDEEELTHRIRGLSTGFVAPAMEGVSVSMARVDDAYLALQPEETGMAQAAPPVPEAPAETVPPPLPAFLARIRPNEIAADLGLGPKDTAADLNERRRAFARDNHPDIVHPAHRIAATERMMIANLLIDRALARIAAMERFGLRSGR